MGTVHKVAFTRRYSKMVFIAIPACLLIFVFTQDADAMPNTLSASQQQKLEDLVLAFTIGDTSKVAKLNRIRGRIEGEIGDDVTKIMLPSSGENSVEFLFENGKTKINLFIDEDREDVTNKEQKKLSVSLTKLINEVFEEVETSMKYLGFDDLIGFEIETVSGMSYEIVLDGESSGTGGETPDPETTVAPDDI